MRNFRLAIAWLFIFGQAHAATVSVTPGTGANFLTKTDGSGNNASSVTVCDATTPTNCTPVDATKGIKIDLSSYFGTAGSANTNVLSMQGIAGGTAVPIGAASGAFASGAFAAGSGTNGWNITEGNTADSAYAGSGSASLVAIGKGNYIATQAVVSAINTSAITGFATATNQEVTVAGVSATSAQGMQGVTGGIAMPVSLSGNQPINEAQINGVTPLMGNGVSGTGSQRVNISSDNTAFAVNAQPSPVTSGGLTTFFLQPTASDNHANIKNGAGQVYRVKVTNNSATINYLRLYNAGTGFNGCNSATNLIDQWAIPASTSGAGFVENIDMGLAFSTGISLCVTSGYATTDTTNATASALSVGIGYK